MIDLVEAKKGFYKVSTQPMTASQPYHQRHTRSSKALHKNPHWHRVAAAVVCLTFLGGVVSPLWASQPETSRVVRSKAHRLYTPVKRRVWIINRPTTPIKAITSEPRFDVSPRELVEVRLIHRSIFIDPNADYIRQGENRVDANGIIPTAQRLYRSLNAKPARIVRRHDHQHATEAPKPSTIRPHMIMMKPPFLQPNQGKRRQKPGKTPIPTVPGPPKEHPRLMALAS